MRPSSASRPQEAGPDALPLLAGVKLADVEQHAREFTSRLLIDSLVHGNFTTDGAVELLDTIEHKLDAPDVDAAELDHHRALKLPPGSVTVSRSPVPSPENVNSAASVYYDIGSANDHDLLARLSLFGQIVKVPVFSTVRTSPPVSQRRRRAQPAESFCLYSCAPRSNSATSCAHLSPSLRRRSSPSDPLPLSRAQVSSSPWVSHAYAGFRIIVQSERTAEYLDERISALEVTLGEHIAGMSEEDFEKEKESLAQKKLEKPKSLGQECVFSSPVHLFVDSAGGSADSELALRSGRYWTEISSGELDFGHRAHLSLLPSSTCSLSSRADGPHVFALCR